MQVQWVSADKNKPNSGGWDAHEKHSESVKGWLLPVMDQVYSTLITDLDQRGLLDETLVCWVAEFGHTPKFYAKDGRDHWGRVFSIALARGGIRGGIVLGHTHYRSYIPEPQLKHARVWTDKPPEQKDAVYANRRRTRGEHGKELQRLRSERTERTFAHVCETGGARRTWLTEIENVRKRYLISAAAHNLGLLMRSLFKMGTPRGLQEFNTDPAGGFSPLHLAWTAAQYVWRRFQSLFASPVAASALPR